MIFRHKFRHRVMERRLLRDPPKIMVLRQTLLRQDMPPPVNPEAHIHLPNNLLHYMELPRFRPRTMAHRLNSPLKDSVVFNRQAATELPNLSRLPSRDSRKDNHLLLTFLR